MGLIINYSYILGTHWLFCIFVVYFLENVIYFLQVLEALLPNGMIIPSAFETVGHIAHLNLRDEHLPYKKIVGKVLYWNVKLPVLFHFAI